MFSDAADLPLLFADFGVPAHYQAGAAAPVPCTVLVDRNVEVYGDLGQVIARRQALTFQAPQVPAPGRGAVVVEQGGAARTWTLDRVIEDDGAIIKVLAQ